MLTVPGIDELWTADFGEPHPGEPAEPPRTPTGRVVRRYERPAPGELVHPYIKRHKDPVIEPDCRGWAEWNGSPASRHAFWRRLCAAVIRPPCGRRRILGCRPRGRTAHRPCLIPQPAGAAGSRTRRHPSRRCSQFDAPCGLHRVGEPVAPDLVIPDGKTGVSGSGETV